jgi:MoaA/NifB/PqqE/SkfB family radical SAM enzyme
MLTGIHFLLSYKCDLECDHCFVYSSPRAKGIFILSQIREVFNEIKKIGTIEWIYFEGGEPFSILSCDG